MIERKKTHHRTDIFSVELLCVHVFSLTCSGLGLALAHSKNRFFCSSLQLQFTCFSHWLWCAVSFRAIQRIREMANTHSGIKSDNFSPLFDEESLITFIIISICAFERILRYFQCISISLFLGLPVARSFHVVARCPCTCPQSHKFFPFLHIDDAKRLEIMCPPRHLMHRHTHIRSWFTWRRRWFSAGRNDPLRRISSHTFVLFLFSFSFISVAEKRIEKNTFGVWQLLQPLVPSCSSDFRPAFHWMCFDVRERC